MLRTLHWVAILIFLTGGARSCWLLSLGFGGEPEVDSRCFFLVAHRRCRPAGYETGHLVLDRKCNESPGAPSPRISCRAWWSTNLMRLSLKRKPHTLLWLGPRSRKSGSFALFAEGWDTTNLATERRVSHPLRRTQRMGHPTVRGATWRAKHQPRPNRELVSSQA